MTLEDKLELTYGYQLWIEYLEKEPVRAVRDINNMLKANFPVETIQKGIRFNYDDCKDLIIKLKEKVENMIITNIKLGNIVDENVDIIVNAANNELKGGSGVDGAIHNAAGWDELDDACREIGHCDTGEAVITPSFQMKNVKHIIHTVGPFCSAHTRFIEEPSEKEQKLLYNCYYNSLKLADEYKAQTVSFPSIATGIYGFPLTYAPKIFKKAVEDYNEVNQNIKEVNMICFDEETKKYYDEVFKVEL